MTPVAGFARSLVIIVLAVGVAGRAWAAEPPLPETPISLALNAKPMSDFVSEMLGRGGLKAVISPRVTGTVSGTFNGSLPSVYRRVTEAFHLRSYYDGAQVYVYDTTEERSSRYGGGLADSRRILRQVESLGLTDTYNGVRLQGDHLVASGGPRFLEQVTNVAGAPTAQRQTLAAAPRGQRNANDAKATVGYQVYPLHYAWAADVSVNSGGQIVTIPGVASLISALIMPERDRTRSIPQLTTEVVPASQHGLGGSGLAAQGRATPQGKSLGTGLAELFGVVQPAPPSSPPVPPPPAARSEEAAEEPRIVADSRLNAVIIRDTPARLASYESLIRALDREPSIIEIDATIIEVDLDRLSAIGLRLEYQGADGNSVTLGSTVPGGLQTTSTPGLVVSAVIGDRNRFMADLHALETRAAVRIVSQPLVVTLSDVEATFQNNRTFYVPVSGSLSTDLYNVASGTRLRVTPHTAGEGPGSPIRLLVDVQDGSISSETVGSLPVIENSGVNTEAIILDGQSLLVGGMVAQSSGIGEGHLPLFGKIPLLGGLFTARRNDLHHVERLFLITPRLRVAGQGIAPPEVAESSLPPLASENAGGAP